MPRVLDPFRFVLIAVGGWMNQRRNPFALRPPPYQSRHLLFRRCDRIRPKYEVRKIIDICNLLIIKVLQRVDIIDAIAVIRDLCGFQIFVYAASDRTFRA
jgi:hypothetical protein